MGRLLPSLLLLLALAAPVRAQDEVSVEAGGIATVVVLVEGDAGDSITYALTAAEEVRSFASPRGVVLLGSDGTGRLPFTFGIPAQAAAGRMVVGRLELAGPAGASEREVAVRVRARREASFWVGVDTATVSPAQALDLGYRLRNAGNATDTFRVAVSAPSRWEQQVTPSRLVLTPGDTAVGSVRLIPPESALRGEEHLVRVRLEGTGVSRSASATVLVVGEESWLGDLAQIPGTVFAGSTSDSDGLPGVAVTASGEIRDGTRVALALRHEASRLTPPAFRHELGGPRARLAIEAPRWKLLVGELLAPASVFTGPTQIARGVEAEARWGGVATRVQVAAPDAYGTVQDDGHLFEAEAAVDRTFGTFGLKLSSVQRRSGFLDDYGLTGGAVTYSLRSARHMVEAEVGVLRVSDDAASRTGPAGSAHYRARWDRGTVSARLRTTPGTTSRTGSQGREALVSGTYSLHPTVSATGWGFLSSSPRVGGEPHSEDRGGAAGLRFRLPADASARLLGQLRYNRHVGSQRTPTLRRSVLAGADFPLGPFRLEATADVGTIDGATASPYRSLRAGTHWSAGRQWGWAGISHYDIGLGNPLTALDVNGSLRVGRTALQAGVNLNLAEAISSRSVSLWSALRVPVARAYELSAGLDYRGGSADPLRLSLGVSRRIGIPLPIHRRPVVEGAVYEDVDGDRVRDPEEPVLPGVAVTFGALRSTTGPDGRYSFHDDGRGSLRVDLSSLPLGTVVPANVVLDAYGTTDIPVIRTASVELRIFFDRDGDQVQDPAERFARGAAVSLRDGEGRVRDTATDADGFARFGNLQAGTYTAIVHPANGRAEPFETTLTVEPGARLERTLAVPLRQREIRLGGGRRPAPDSAAARAEVRVRIDDRRDIESRIHFYFDGTELTAAARARLQALIDELRSTRGGRMMIIGHTDARGSAAYNQRLSRQRAAVAAEYLSGMGVPVDRMEVVGMGEAEPIATNETAEGRRINRRVEIRVVPPDG